MKEMSTGYTDAELLKLDLQLEALFKKRGIPTFPPPTRENIHIKRKGFAGAIARFNNSPFAQHALPSKPNWTETDHAVPARNGRKVPIRIYKPVKPKTKGHAVLLFAPAGGWCVGGLDTEAFLCRLFCSRLGMLVVNIAYGLYPEVAFHVPQQDCLDVGKWVAGNARSLGGDLSAGFVWGGNSGGCTWMAVAAHRWREEGGLDLPCVTGCFWLCPIFTNEFEDGEGRRRRKYDWVTENRSLEQCRDAPLMNREISKSIEGLITYDFSSKLLSPLRFESHDGVGVTYVAVTGIDPWRDTGVLYAQEVRRDDLPVMLDFYPGLLHSWWSTFPQIDATKEWLRRSLAGMQWVLENGSNAKGSTAKL